MKHTPKSSPKLLVKLELWIDLRSGEWMDLPQERQQKEFQLSHADVGWSQSATKGVLCDFEQVFLAESLLGTWEILHWSERS